MTYNFRTHTSGDPSLLQQATGPLGVAYGLASDAANALVPGPQTTIPGTAINTPITRPGYAAPQGTPALPGPPGTSPAASSSSNTPLIVGGVMLLGAAAYWYWHSQQKKSHAGSMAPQSNPSRHRKGAHHRYKRIY